MDAPQPHSDPPASIPRPPRTLIVCKSVHHGNTARVARALADVLGAEVVDPDDLSPEDLSRFDLVGFGSGIYYARPHCALRRFVAGIVRPPRAAFVFTTSGLPGLRRLWHAALKRRLERCGCPVVGEFHCRGWDTFGPLRLLGGIARRRPDDRDLARARSFAEDLCRRLASGTIDD